MLCWDKDQISCKVSRVSHINTSHRKQVNIYLTANHFLDTKGSISVYLRCNNVYEAAACSPASCWPCPTCLDNNYVIIASNVHLSCSRGQILCAGHDFFMLTWNVPRRLIGFEAKLLIKRSEVQTNCYCRKESAATTAESPEKRCTETFVRVLSSQTQLDQRTQLWRRDELVDPLVQRWGGWGVLCARDLISNTDGCCSAMTPAAKKSKSATINQPKKNNPHGFSLFETGHRT